jgi:transcriptional regulator with PAS, ATPase and Fis domain
MAYRVVAKLEDQTIRHTLQPGRNLIGSDADCEICLPNTTVSRQHAALTVDGEKVELQDLGSTNGTLMSSQRIERCMLQSGDGFVIGRVVVVLEQVEADDLEAAIVLPRVGVDPSGTIRVDFDAMRENTDSFTPLDRYALDHLPKLLDRLRKKPNHHAMAQMVGYALYESMPVVSVEVLEIGSKERGILYTAERSADQATLPQWVESKTGHCQVRACFHSRRAADHYKPVVTSAALLLALVDESDVPTESLLPVKTTERPHPLTVDPKVRLIYDQAERVSRGDVGVLICGESGTGKEVLAGFIHAASPRATKPLVAINCASLPRDLLEAELFGVERGVATGVDARAGKFEAADGGTLFLDEIGDMAQETQAKILRVLQEQQVFRIGGHTPRAARARVVAATNSNIHQMLADGSFRNDLYHRIATWEVELPPLRHRRADVSNLAAHFLSLEAKRYGIRVRGISRAALRALRRYNWPGNIRQLKNEISRAVLFLEDRELLDMARLNPSISSSSESTTGTSLTDILENVERDEILTALDASGGDIGAAADTLQVSRPTLYRRIKSLGIQASDS